MYYLHVSIYYILLPFLTVSSLNFPFGREGWKVLRGGERRSNYSLLTNTESNNLDNLEIVQFIDQGRYSNVYEAVNITSNSMIIIKIYKLTLLSRLLREVNILKKFIGVNGIVQILGFEMASSSIFFNHLGNNLQWLEQKGNIEFNYFEIQFYMYKLLLAVNECHSRGIIHRDIKPRNVLIDRTNRLLTLIDFGLSECYTKNTWYNCNVASKFYKAPELLFDDHYYDMSIDIWSCGCILAGLLFKEEPFFGGNDIKNQITSIASVVGSSSILQWINDNNRCNKTCSSSTDSVNGYINITKIQLHALGQSIKTPFKEFINCKNSKYFVNNSESYHAIDLIEKMLTVNPRERINVSQCLIHPFFHSLRSTQI
jgi:casein kinase II subunit alpha